MTAAVAAAVLAISFTAGNNSGKTIKYPSTLSTAVVREKDIPYPKTTAAVSPYDGGWTSGRLTDRLGFAMYGSFDAILQRYIFPRWYNWGAQKALAVGDVCSYDFFPATNMTIKGRSYLNRQGSPFFFSLPPTTTTALDNLNEVDVSPSLGYFNNGASRDFSAKGVRIWVADDLAYCAITNSVYGLSSSWDLSGDACAHYWLAPESVASSLVTSTELLEDPLGSAPWASQFFLFLGDYNQSDIFPGTFSRIGYTELKDIHPSWALSYYENKGYESFATLFADYTLAKRTKDSIGTLLNGGDGAQWLKGVAAKPKTKRITLDRFALLNSAASLCQTAFLGTKTAKWEQISESASIGQPLYPTQPCADIRYKSVVYQGTLSSSNSVEVNLTPLYNEEYATWGLRGDLASAIQSLVSGGMDFDGEITSVYTQYVSSVSAGWYDKTAKAGIFGSVAMGVSLADIAIEYPPAGISWNPFDNEPEAKKGTWVLDATVMDKTVFLQIIPAKVVDDEGNLVDDPKSVFADGSTTRSLCHGHFKFRDGTNVQFPLDVNISIAFKGREVLDVCDFYGPTFMETGGLDAIDSTYDKSLLPVTFAQQLYSAGIVKTALPAYQTVGVAAGLSAAAAVAENGDFSGDALEKYVYSRYVPPTIKFGSKVGWEGGWRAFITKSDIDTTFEDGVAKFMTNQQTFDKSIFLYTHDPTRKAALDGYSNDAKNLFTQKLIGAFSSPSATDFYPAEYVFYPGAVQVITDGEIPGDYFLGTVVVYVYFAPITDGLDDIKRSSLAVTYDKKALPLAFWNFPAMNGAK